MFIQPLREFAGTVGKANCYGQSVSARAAVSWTQCRGRSIGVHGLQLRQWSKRKGLTNLSGCALGLTYRVHPDVWYHRGRVKSHYSDENEQSYYSEDNLSEVFAMPRPARSDSKLPNDWRRSPFHTASTPTRPAPSAPASLFRGMSRSCLPCRGGSAMGRLQPIDRVPANGRNRRNLAARTPLRERLKSTLIRPFAGAIVVNGGGRKL